jgi:hypothetical protein
MHEGDQADFDKSFNNVFSIGVGVGVNFVRNGNLSSIEYD